MLINEPSIMYEDPILTLIGKVNGNNSGTTKLADGVYEISHFGSSHFLRGYEQYPDLGEYSCYGVCDSLENLLLKLAVLQDAARKFVVTLTPVKRSNQAPDGGWRWHKWGEYIGSQNPQHEYLYDETDIDEVFCYHVYEQEVQP